MRLFALIIIFCWLLVTFNFSKTVMVLLVCLAFIGQATASVIMSYHMMGMTGMNGQEQSQDMSMMDHSNHFMASSMVSDSSSFSAESSTESSDEPSEKSMEECCNETCSCFTGGCSYVAVFMKIASNAPIVDLSSKILSYSRLAQSQQSASLYRPPILR